MQVNVLNMHLEFRRSVGLPKALHTLEVAAQPEPYTNLVKQP